MQATSDEELIGRIASGDRLAMQVLFARHHVRVFRFVLRLVRDESVAEDLISEVFLDVWRQAGRFEGGLRFHLVVGDRALQGSDGIAAQAGRGAGRRSCRGDRGSVGRSRGVAGKKDKSAVLRKCLEGLSAEHREIIDLVYYHEKSVEEVAEIVGIPENTVKTRMFYARKRLAELLKTTGIERGWP
jgi:RNA polymerase sigma-70 factor (ECF subfamily)